MPEATPAAAPQKLLMEEGGSLEAQVARLEGGGLGCVLDGGGGVVSGFDTAGAWLLSSSDVGPDILSMVCVPH